MVYIKFDIGSRAKGYNTEDSDYDYVIITKCDESDFLLYLDNRNRLVNRHDKTEEGDCTHVDLYNALMGIYKGTYYYLGIFAGQEDIIDKYGQPNTELFTFIRALTDMRMPNIMKTMCRAYRISSSSSSSTKKESKKSPDNPKNLLAMMFHLAFVDRWLRVRKFPEHRRLPELLFNNGEQVALYESLMQKRRTGASSSSDEVQYMQQWQETLMARLDRIPPLPERFDVRKAIVMYMMNEGAPVMPLERHITKLIYPSIQQLSRSVCGALWHKEVLVQEKLDGCNFRIIVDEGSISYGSRNTYRVRNDFMGYHSIRDHLEMCARRLQQATGFKSLVVYGELVGWLDAERTKPLNEISYVAQQEQLKYYAYDIKCCDDGNEEDVEFELAQNLLANGAGFDTIPYETFLYEDFVRDIKFRSLLFPEHNDDSDKLIEGYIVRCNGLKYKLKKEYNLNELSKTNALLFLTPQFVRNAVPWPVNESNFTEAAALCYKAVLPYNEVNPLPPAKIFGKIFGLLCESTKLLHKDFKTKLNEFLSLVNNNV
ncbi:HE65 [Agrotis ipsilon multiple nucleopolyhedrovirus]|uniref:HE65 n=1 Tax=Agrotis ipsilon multiple nucleopolyhedrovirus TaxID=208013 RepID=B6D5T9_9ABAC|nr:HE65 [Agrotis ipsilon multiple nucleopolyhedrovirus]ACI28727.1 HE65 [Agrotis ipsilon multiple nucleopolyhedrovirus]